MVSSRVDRREEIKTALAAMTGTDFPVEAEALLNALGYRSERVPPDSSGDVDDFLSGYPALNPDTQSEQRFLDEAASVRILFQVTDEEIAEGATGRMRLIKESAFDTGNVKSFLFAAVELRGKRLPTGHLRLLHAGDQQAYLRHSDCRSLPHGRRTPHLIVRPCASE